MQALKMSDRLVETGASHGEKKEPYRAQEKGKGRSGKRFPVGRRKKASKVLTRGDVAAEGREMPSQGRKREPAEPKGGGDLRRVFRHERETKGATEFLRKREGDRSKGKMTAPIEKKKIIQEARKFHLEQSEERSERKINKGDNVLHPKKGIRDIRVIRQMDPSA